MSKGHTQRDKSISEKEWADNYDRIFGKADCVKANLSHGGLNRSQQIDLKDFVERVKKPFNENHIKHIKEMEERLLTKTIKGFKA
jgi:hypothetical protein